MPLIYLVRHGQTDWNAELRLQGQFDTPLNETGRAQAARNGDVLRELVHDPGAFDFVASPLSRTRETMEIIRERMGLDPKAYRTDDQLKEIHFGEWQGFTWDELREKDTNAIAARFDDPWNTIAPGPDGESYAMLSARAVAWLDAVSRDTLVVTHGGINRCIRGHLERLDKVEIARMDVPQDKVLVIENGRTSWA